MKVSLLLGALTAFAFGLISCAAPATAPADPHAGHTMQTGVKKYTSDKCIVTGNKLGSMGDPVSYVHSGQEVKFCCDKCIDKFKANPEKYLAKVK